MANYQKTSPWSNTSTVNNQYLDVLTIRPVPEEGDDILYEIEEQYTHRPDLLAYDLYVGGDGQESNLPMTVLEPYTRV